MSKNTPFTNRNQVVKTDPVAEAHKEALAKDTATNEVPMTGGLPTELLVDVNVAETAKAVEVTSEKPVDQGEAVVKDTTQPVSKELEKSNIIKPAVNVRPSNTVQRPIGANTREASPASTGQAKQTVVSNEFSALIGRERTNGTANAVGLIAFLDTYVKVMAPGKITPVQDIIKYQEGLYDQLMTVISRAPAKEFGRLWNIVISYFREYKKACFSPLCYSRGARDWKRDPKQFLVLTSLLNLLEASADDITKVNEVVNVNAVVGKGFSEDARGRVINFYLK